MLQCVRTLISFFFYLFFLIQYFFSFEFSFLFMIFDDEEAHDCGHMTCHMMWDHKPKLWEKGLKE